MHNCPCDAANKSSDPKPRATQTPPSLSPLWPNWPTHRWTRSTTSAPLFTPPGRIGQAHDPRYSADSCRSPHESGKVRSSKQRKHQLLQLAYFLQDNRETFNESIKNDLGRSPLENEMHTNSRQARAKQLHIRGLETFLSLAEVKQSFGNVERCTKPESVPLSFSLTSPKMRKEVKGVILIFVPYNYLIFVLMNPIASVMNGA